MHLSFVHPIVLQPANIDAVHSEGFADPKERGNVSWKTLISSPATATNTFTVGIATCKPGKQEECRGHLKAHRHKQAEIYHITSGRGIVTIEEKEYPVEKGTVVWIPGDAEHGIRNAGDGDLVWLYAFAADSFAEILYRFDEPGPSKIRAKL